MCRREFLEVKKSFFVKANIKEANIGAHVVLLIANITKSLNPRSNSCMIELSDGSYSLQALVFGDENTNEAHGQKGWDCDKKLLKMINSGYIKPGDKFHFFGLHAEKRDLPGFDKLKPKFSKHVFLQNTHLHYLKVNLNGLARAHFETRLGE